MTYNTYICHCSQLIPQFQPNPAATNIPPSLHMPEHNTRDVHGFGFILVTFQNCDGFG